jgi:ABC-type transport system involved in multi-copper enzyme maturation permease subunit
MTPHPPARFRDLAAAEWIKLRSLRSTPWALAVTALVVVAAAATAAHADYVNFPTYSPEIQREHAFALADAFPLLGYLTLMVVATSMGAAAIVGEYSSGLIRTTTVAVPARAQVVLAKAVVVTALWTVAGAIIAGASFAVAQAILDLRHAAAGVTEPDTLVALVAATLVAPVCALFGLGLGVIIRHGITTAVIGIIALVMLPQAFSTRRPLAAEINHTMVLSAWQRLTQSYGSPEAVGSLYTPFRQAWIVYAAWPLIAVLAALVVVRRRDV